MSVIINQTGNEVYFGNLKVATAAVKPGAVVLPDDSAGTCAVPTDTDDTLSGGYGLALVCNYDPYADTNVTDTKDFSVAIGKYARLKNLQVGDEFTTDCIIGTYANIAVDDVMAVNGIAASGASGHWIAIGSRTPVLRVKVIGKTTLFGNNALKFRVISA